MSWVVDNLENALETWNEKMAEIWQLITQSPTEFKGGGIWDVMVNINGAVQAIGLGLLVLFFVVGVIKTCGSFAEVKKPEHALKLFIRFVLAKAAVTYGLELMMSLFKIVQGLISTIMTASGFSGSGNTVLPQTIIDACNDCGFFESIPLWAVTLIGGLFITVLSFIMIMSVYGRFFKLYLYTAIAPVPLSSFAGEPSQSVGKGFIKSYAAVCLEGAIIVLACIIFSLFASAPPAVDPNAAAVTMVWSYIGELIFNMLVLVGAVKMADRVVRESLPTENDEQADLHIIKKWLKIRQMSAQNIERTRVPLVEARGSKKKTCPKGKGAESLGTQGVLAIDCDVILPQDLPAFWVAHSNPLYASVIVGKATLKKLYFTEPRAWDVEFVRGLGRTT